MSTNTPMASESASRIMRERVWLSLIHLALHGSTIPSTMTASKLPISRSPRTASYGIVVTPPFSWPATSSTSTPSCTAKWRWVEVASVAWVMWSWACSGSCGSSHLLVPCNTVPGRSVCVGHERISTRCEP